MSPGWGHLCYHDRENHTFHHFHFHLQNWSPLIALPLVIPVVRPLCTVGRV